MKIFTKRMRIFTKKNLDKSGLDFFEWNENFKGNLYTFLLLKSEFELGVDKECDNLMLVISFSLI